MKSLDELKQAMDEAEEEWNKLSDKDREEIIAFVPAYNMRTEKEGGKYRKNADNFFY